MGMPEASDRERIVAALAANEPCDTTQPASWIAECEGEKAIPFLIGVIDADNDYWTVYGVGYSVLRSITGVEYSEFHDGAWWRRWWEANRAARFPGGERHADPGVGEDGARAVVQAVTRRFRHPPRKAEACPRGLDELKAKREYRNHHPRIKWDTFLTEMAKHEDPHVIPYLLGFMAADPTTSVGVQSVLAKITGIQPEYVATHQRPRLLLGRESVLP